MSAHSQASQTLQQRIAQIEAMAEVLQARTAYVDAQQRYQFVSKHYEQLYGLPDSEILGKTLQESMESSDYQRAQPHVETVLGGSKVSFSCVGVSDSGQKHHVLINYTPYVDDLGEVLGFFVVCQDMTKRKSLEEELQWMTFQMNTLTTLLPGKFSYLDSQLRYRFVSKQYQEWYEKPSEEIVGRTVEELMGVEGAQKLRGYIEQALTGQEVHYEFTKLFEDGEERTMVIDYIPHFSDSGEILGFFVSCQDITELKRLREIVRESEMRVPPVATGALV